MIRRVVKWPKYWLNTFHYFEPLIEIDCGYIVCDKGIVLVRQCFEVMTVI